MQCCVASPSHLSPRWPCEVLRAGGKAIGGSRRWGWDSASGRKRRRNEEEGTVHFSSGRTSASSRWGFAGNGMLGGSELRKRTEVCFRSSSAAAAERKEGGRVRASLMVDPAVWIIRTTVFYVLLETGVAAPGRPRSSSESEDQKSKDAGPLAWIGNLFGGDPEEQRNKELAKLRSKWHANTKGVLVRRYRVPSKAGGRKLLNAISSLLADDDTFRDVATHKGCQIRRENAHAESVCCHNVRALFDELPTPHLVVEITVFPPGPINTTQYEKADKIEKVLKTGASI